MKLWRKPKTFIGCTYPQLEIDEARIEVIKSEDKEETKDGRCPSFPSENIAAATHRKIQIPNVWGFSI